jgi:hypothetical protein
LKNQAASAEEPASILPQRERIFACLLGWPLTATPPNMRSRDSLTMENKT